MSKKVAFIVFLFATFGLLAQVAVYFEPEPSVENSMFWIRQFLEGINLMFIHFRHLSNPSVDTHILILCLEGFFYLLLLLGGFAYVFSKGRETRLVLFVSAIVFLGNTGYAIAILCSLLFPTLYGIIKLYTPILPWLVLLVKCVVFSGAAYYVLTTLRKNKNPEDESTGALASISKRLTHFILDTFTCMYFLGVFIPSAVTRFLLDVAYPVGYAFYLMVDLALLGVCYYPFFEIIFGATPAHFLTGAGVVSQTGEKPSTTQTFKRAFARYIPFEFLSFLGASGLHDQLSGTRMVIRAKTNAGWYYGLALVCTAALAVAAYFILYYYKYSFRF